MIPLGRGDDDSTGDGGENNVRASTGNVKVSEECTVDGLSNRAGDVVVSGG